MKIVEFAPGARAELDAAADWYERARTGRGQRLYAAVERVVQLIAAFSAAGPPFPEIDPELGVRRCVVRGFPFVLAYRVLGDVVRIEAVAHTRRRPGYWRLRIR